MKFHSNTASFFDQLEGRSMLAADLAIAISPITITDPNTPAELVRVTGTVSNIGDAVSSTGGQLRFLLSADDTVDAGDLELGTNYLGDYNPGDVVPYDLAVARPTTAQVPAGQYRIIATLQLPGGSSDNPANNVAVSAETVQIGDVLPPPPPPATDTFGLVNGQRVTLTKTLADGQIAVFKLDGPGSGSLVQENGEWMVTLNGTTNDSVLKIRRADTATADPVLGGVTVNGNIGHIHMYRSDVDGNVTITGTINHLRLDDVSNGTISIGGEGKWTFFQADTLTDVTVRSEGEFGLVKVNTWQSKTDAPDQLIADRVQVLTARNFAADVILNNSTGKALWVAGIRNITGGTWNITGQVGNVYARNIAEGWEMGVNGTLKTFRADSSLTNVSVAATSIDHLQLRGLVTGSTFIAGANLGADARLGGIDAAADTFAGGTIKKIDLRNGASNSMFIAGVNPTDGTFGNADDVYLSPSVIRTVNAHGTLSNTLFIAQTAPSAYKHEAPRENGNGGNRDHNDDNGRNNSRGKTKKSGGGLFARR